MCKIDDRKIIMTITIMMMMTIIIIININNDDNNCKKCMGVYILVPCLYDSVFKCMNRGVMMST